MDLMPRSWGSMLRSRKQSDVASRAAPSVESSTGSVSTPPLKIAIVGAGIGGLCLAIGCLKNNVPYVLYEAAKEFSTVGAGVGLGPNALKAMEMIEPKLRPMYNDISSGNLTPDKDHVMFDALYAEEGFGSARGWKPVSFGAECYDRTSAHRKDLLDILTSQIPLDTVHFNKRAKHVHQATDRVFITFEDGQTVEAAAVIGCDGAKGATRGFVLGDKYPEEVEASYSGKYAYRSIVPMKDAQQLIDEKAGDARAFCGKGLTFITFPISRGTRFNLVAFKHSKEPWNHDQWTESVTREQMLADFENEVDPRLLKLLNVRVTTRKTGWDQHFEANNVKLNSGLSLVGGLCITT